MSKYEELGVEARKKSPESLESLLDRIFPNAFCPVAWDEESRCGIILKTDGAGSKPVQSYIHYKETGDIGFFNGLAQDVIAMNIDDLICVAPTAESLTFADYIAINPLKIPKPKLLNSVVPKFRECLDNLKQRGITIKFLGGETADLPDQIKTLDISGIVSGRAKEFVTGERVEPGDIIIGLRSGGKCKYERAENSGIMCNGITMARHYLMKNEYEEKYPEIKDSAGKGYFGGFAFDQYLDEIGMSVGEAILSPTRIFAPVIKKVFKKHKQCISGLVHNTGGGITKCLRIGKNIRYIKYDLFDPDEIFLLLQRESKTTWKEMHEDFNMGQGFEIIARPTAANGILDTIERCGLEAKIIGRCEKSDGQNKLKIKSKFGYFSWP